jgi:hypothetical protein
MAIQADQRSCPDAIKHHANRPVPLEYSIAWLICAVTCGREALMAG